MVSRWFDGVSWTQSHRWQLVGSVRLDNRVPDKWI
jgi:hypothetical protein